jgi:hypothetical protein
MVAGQQLSGPGQSGLHFIGYEKHIFLLTEVMGLAKESLIRHIYSGFPLNGFYQEPGHIGILQGLFPGPRYRCREW